MSILIFLHSILCFYFTKLQPTCFYFLLPRTPPCYRFPLQALGLAQPGEGPFRKNRIVLHPVDPPASPPHSSRGGRLQQGKQNKPGFVTWTLIVSVGAAEQGFTNPHPFQLSKQPACDLLYLPSPEGTNWSQPPSKCLNFKGWIAREFYGELFNYLLLCLKGVKSPALSWTLLSSWSDYCTPQELPPVRRNGPFPSTFPYRSCQRVVSCELSASPS